MKTLRRRHLPAASQFPHTLTSSAPNAAALAAATGRRRRTQRAHPRDSIQTTRAHVTRRARPILLPGHVLSGRPPHLGKMAAPSRVPRFWVQVFGQRVGSLLTNVSKPFCSAAAASRPLDAQRLAERLRAQKQDQKTKKVPVSLEGRIAAPKRQCAQLFYTCGVNWEGPLRGQ